ncbi:MAG: hypothetical protein EBS19_02210 [Spirochaetia bacterium]|nr:hypothetical protein [Spirochaetia bacterium]
MSLLPYDNFSWISREEFNEMDWKNINTEEEYGYVLEVDLIYPVNLHQQHNDFPLAPEKIKIEFNDLSNFTKRVLKRLENRDKYKDFKLIGTFNDRVRYVTHFKNLKLYLQQGLILKKIHRVISFRQVAFIAPFIEKCTLLRQQSKTKFEQDQFKKVANCVYGKTIQNARNYIKVKLHTNQINYLKAVSEVTFKNFSILGDNLVQTNHSLDDLKHKRPISVGFTILELSKHFMFDFYYNKLLKGLNCKLELGMSDTDSFLFKVSNKRKFRKHIHPYMDYSNYPSDHPLHNLSNKSKLGYFKDELSGVFSCKEFVGLKAKCYALKLEHKTTKDIKEKKVCKGLGRVAINNRLRFKHYKECLFSGVPKRYDFHIIKSRKHQITTSRINKKAISHFDSKRWIHSCGIHSDPYGSVFIQPSKTFPCPKCS